MIVNFVDFLYTENCVNVSFVFEMFWHGMSPPPCVLRFVNISKVLINPVYHVTLAIIGDSG